MNHEPSSLATSASPVEATMDHQRQLEGMFGGMGTKELKALIIVAATEFAARHRESSPIREQVDAGAAIEVVVSFTPPSARCMLVNSEGWRRMIAFGSLWGKEH